MLENFSKEDLIKIIDHQDRQLSLLAESNELMAQKLGIDPMEVELVVEGMESAEKGGFSINLKSTNSLSFFGEKLVKNFRDSTAQNYLTIGILDAQTMERFEVILQKVSGESPTAQCQRLRQEVANLKQQLEDGNS